MTWRVRLLNCGDGSTPDVRYSEGVRIADQRSGAFDLIVKANKRWNTHPIPGEVYSVTPEVDGTCWRVMSESHIEPA